MGERSCRHSDLTVPLGASGGNPTVFVFGSNRAHSAASLGHRLRSDAACRQALSELTRATNQSEE